MTLKYEEAKDIYECWGRCITDKSDMLEFKGSSLVHFVSSTATWYQSSQGAVLINLSQKLELSGRGILRYKGHEHNHRQTLLSLILSDVTHTNSNEFKNII